MLLSVLGQGGMGIVYRAIDRLTGQVVALKQVTASFDKSRDTPSGDTSDFRLALSDEFRTLASLRHPNIISVIDYGFDVGQPYFTMELLENPRTILTAAQDLRLDEQVQLLVEPLQALAYLHRRGVLHRDLKPGNIFLDEDGIVKVVDFGLSIPGTYSRTNVQQNTAGTLAYMAPELFSEEAATVASDLYAVGIIACELLSGHHPFNQKNVALLISGILSLPPDLSGLEGELAAVVGRLLAKQPEDRYGSAVDAIEAFCRAIAQTPPLETAAIRESFLQAAKFVGRSSELESLKQALSSILTQQRSTPSADVSITPHAWLVAGESGVGKSRLLDELRIRALVRGAVVLRGQSITEGSVPYQLWRDPLRRLILMIDLSDDDAGVIKTLVPDIDTLLERTIPEAPPLDPQSSQSRFVKVVTDVFRLLKQPTVVILEDLQWAGDENLDLLNRLIPLTVDIPLLFIASCRDDERPDLHKLLSGIQLLKLKRLDEAGIAELSESILGDGGRHPQIVELLQRETEGNVFFLIELVRALADQAGRLGLIGEADFHNKVLPKGIQDIIQRRLDRVDQDSYHLLYLAALAGRELDLDVLDAFAPNITAAVKVMRPDAADNGRVWPEVGDVVATLTTPEQNRALA